MEDLGDGAQDIDFDDNTLERYRISRTPSPIIIKNCVATAFFGTQLDLEEISWKKYGEFNPSSFAAAKFRLSSPSTTALIFASGKIVCTGGASEESAEVAILKYFRMVNSVDPKAVCIDICIENIVGTGYLGHAINLHDTFAWLKSEGYVTAMYSPELFPGLRFVPKDLAPYLPPTKVLVFQEGNVVICGAKAREELLQTWIILRQILKQFEQETVRLLPLYLSAFSHVLTHLLHSGIRAAPVSAQKNETMIKPETLLFVAFLVGWLWLVNKIAIEWLSSIAFEQNRLKEAELVIMSVCSTFEGASLGYEFIKCAEARVLLENKGLVWMRAFERTIKTVASETLQVAGSMTFSAIGHVAIFMILASGTALMFTVAQERALRIAARSSGEIDMYSPAAQARMKPWVEMGQLSYYVDVNKEKAN